jgi:hypothetical protein
VICTRLRNKSFRGFQPNGSVWLQYEIQELS